MMAIVLGFQFKPANLFVYFGFFYVQNFMFITYESENRAFRVQKETQIYNQGRFAVP